MIKENRYRKALEQIRDLMGGELPNASIVNKHAEEYVTIYDGVPVKTVRKLEKIRSIVWQALKDESRDTPSTLRDFQGREPR
jgi:hypothetical protein